jgi:hypothetical protein
MIRGIERNIAPVYALPEGIADSGLLRLIFNSSRCNPDFSMIY